MNFSHVTPQSPPNVIQKVNAGETILFLGNFTFDLDLNATSFRDLLTGRGYIITEVSTPPSEITLSYLNQYDAIVLDDLSGSVSAGEADIFFEYVVNHSENLLLLGNLIGVPSADRNMIGDKFGIHFNDDLFCDPERYIAYNGGCATSDGDPDNGVEYALLQNFANHPVTDNVSSFLLNWGQSLTVSGSSQSIAWGTSSSWGDQNPIWDSAEDCNDGWFINTDDNEEPHGNLVGIAVFESGGKVVGIGDQDMLWNFWFYGGDETLFGNIFSWFFLGQKFDITITTSPVGLQLSVDNISYTSPHTFDWISSSVHEIEVSSPQSTGEGIRFVYDYWSDGLGQTHDITTPSESTTYTSFFDTQYYLTIEADPESGGTVSPSDGWFGSGEQVQIEATINNEYNFFEWEGTGTGSYSGDINPVMITMDDPITQTAKFDLIDAIELIDTDIPKEFALHQNYPNPFNPSTTIEYILPQDSHVTLSIYNISGQVMSVLKDEYQSAGNYSVTWDASEISNDLYFCTLKANGFTQTRKMVPVLRPVLRSNTTKDELVE